jgi:HEAT repeat protein
MGCTTGSHTPPKAAVALGTSATNERDLIRTLKSKAPKADKAIACKRLAVYGTEEAVPALAGLLPDAELNSWARIALEAIPGPAADDALRKAMGRLKGRLLVGTINSIGVRRDAKAVVGLGKKLKDADVDVASAAALALGHIGDAQAAKILEADLLNAPGAVRAAVGEGCILCAERALLTGDSAAAVKLYDEIRAAKVPRQTVLEATRGAILARGSDGLPLLLEQLRSTDKDFAGIGLRTARELPGIVVTAALGKELERCSPERQVFLLLAIADRSDSGVMPIVIQSAQSRSAKLRLAAVGVLDRLGDPFGLPTLLYLAAEGDKALAPAALTAVARMPGSQVDKEILTRLQASNGKMREVLITLAGRRRIEAAVPMITQYAEDTDAGCRRAAVQALGDMGGTKQVGDLARLLSKAQNEKERADIEIALVGIASRNGTNCVAELLPLAQSEESAVRIIAMNVLGSAGGPQALAAVKAAVEDKDEAVQAEAVRTLSTWPNNWPEDSAVAEPLLTLAKSAAKPSYQVLALRGYLQYVKEDKQLKAGEKMEMINDLQPLLKRAEEKRLAIATLDTIPTAASVAMLTSFAADPDLAEDTSAALLNLAGKDHKGVSKAERKKALQLVVEKTKNDETKKKAEKLLKDL